MEVRRRAGPCHDPVSQDHVTQVNPRARVGVIVPAAGAGARMGGARKQYLELAGVPVLLRAIRPFLARPDVTEVVVAVPAEDIDNVPTWLSRADDRLKVVAGGASRFESVGRGLAALGPDASVVAVHDGVRPLVAAQVIERCLYEASQGRVAVAGVPAVDTIKRVNEVQEVLDTPDRSLLWNAQTPQVFPRGLLEEGYRRWDPARGTPTDDAALMECLDCTVVMVRGDRSNMKVTHPGDLAIAAALIDAGADG